MVGRTLVAAAGLVLLLAADSQAVPLPCAPCVATRVDDPAALIQAAGGQALAGDDQVFMVFWDSSVGAAGASDMAGLGEIVRGLTALGATPAPRLIFDVPAPISQNAGALAAALEGTAVIARQLTDNSIVQIEWRPSTGDWTPSDYAFLFKRAAVALTGELPNVRVMTSALVAEVDRITDLWKDELAAYADIVALQPVDAAGLAATTTALAALDPGIPVFVDSLGPFDDPLLALARTAEVTVSGATGAIVELRQPDAAALGPLRSLVRESAGDVSPDPGSAPNGGRNSWSFARGDDLSLRVIVEADSVGSDLSLRFPFSTVRNIESIDMATGERLNLGRGRRSDDGVDLTINDSPSVVVLRIERLSAAEIEGIEGLADQVLVASERDIPVEEILRRLQAVEDAQYRRLHHYQAVNESHLRFELEGIRSLEVTFRGDFFFLRDEGFDWAWQEFLFNGVRWRGKRIPEIPLIQPEKAAALPVDINFTQDYRYTLRGTDVIRDRDCWVVEFRPIVKVEGKSLFQGTVWIDREHFFRVRTKAIQLGLRGDVLSSEETTDFYPFDETGGQAPWTSRSIFLGTHRHGQQIFSLLNNSIIVETENILSAVQINGSGFTEARQRVLESDSTMVRDTEEGIRYLVTDKETGEREVQDRLRPNRLFGAAGILWDESFDYPAPLVGVDFLSFDFMNTGAQVNALLAGVVLDVSIADPTFFGSRWDAGADLFALAISGSDSVFIGETEQFGQEVKVRPANLDLALGHPIGAFTKIDLRYDITSLNYSEADNTSPDFMLPSDHFVQSAGLGLRYNRNGYRFRLGGSLNDRSEWDPWGFEDNPDYSPDKKSFAYWNAGLSKIWHLQNFRKFGAEVGYVDGRDLDRFSKYDFGLFSDLRVHGYQSGKIKAESAYSAHLSYGLGFGETFRLDLVGDFAWATDRATDLDNEFLAGFGVVGTITGPWSTIINMDLGVAAAGPDSGVGVLLTVLKLFGSV